MKYCTKKKEDEVAEAKEYGKTHIPKRKTAAGIVKAAEKLERTASGSLESSLASLEELGEKSSGSNAANRPAHDRTAGFESYVLSGESMQGTAEAELR